MKSIAVYAYSVRRLDGAEAVSGKIVVVSIGENGRPVEINGPCRAALEA